MARIVETAWYIWFFLSAFKKKKKYIILQIRLQLDLSVSCSILTGFAIPFRTDGGRNPPSPVARPGRLRCTPRPNANGILTFRLPSRPSRSTEAFSGS